MKGCLASSLSLPWSNQRKSATAWRWVPLLTAIIVCPLLVVCHKSSACCMCLLKESSHLHQGRRVCLRLRTSCGFVVPAAYSGSIWVAFILCSRTDSRSVGLLLPVHSLPAHAPPVPVLTHSHYPSCFGPVCTLIESMMKRIWCFRNSCLSTKVHLALRPCLTFAGAPSPKYCGLMPQQLKGKYLGKELLDYMMEFKSDSLFRLPCTGFGILRSICPPANAATTPSSCRMLTEDRLASCCRS